MLFFLAAGILLGAVSVVFLLQNLTVVTITFLSWEITASLALILFGTLLCGMLIIALVLLPSLIRDDFRLASLRRQKKTLEQELETQKVAAKPVTENTPIEDNL